ncbi:MAG TPA: YbdK family carboxylate-amine ligase [Gaiellaceae bacterium]|nr:YbdK family carboxylate-amine ligase [Gaiellaceae bacterium]
MVDNFGRSLTLGVEEELMLLDPETLALAPGVERLLPREGLKTELFSCLVETNTPVCETAFEAREELVRLRRLVVERAARQGLVVAATGSHPFSIPEEQPIVDEPRYLEMVEELGSIAKAQLVCGLHVHVGMESFDACLRALAGIRLWLPALLELSANSPYLVGEETGALSSRLSRLRQLPRAGPPPRLETVADWEAAVTAAGVDYTRIWWDARPHPRLGTLEVRIADQATSVERAAALVALVQALCAAPPEPGPDLIAAVEPAARELGTWELVETLRDPVEALRQLEVGRRDGLEAVAADLVKRSAAG